MFAAPLDMSNTGSPAVQEVVVQNPVAVAVASAGPDFVARPPHALPALFLLGPGDLSSKVVKACDAVGKKACASAMRAQVSATL